MILGQKDLNDMLATAEAAARLAGRYALEEIYTVETSVKNGNELVTQADSRCQKLIIDRVRQSYPNHGFIAEEGESGKMFKHPPSADAPLWWVIDPIDGTNNYAHHLILFTVSIAVMHADKPIVGVIYEPATDSMFTAVKGGQAKLNGRVITAGEQTMDEFSSVGLDSHFDTGVPAWACEIIQRTKYRNLGSAALQMAYVANGGLTATIMNAPKLWDIAAGAVIIEAAGGVTTDWQGRDIFPVDPVGYDGRKFNVIAANKKGQREIVELLKA